MPADVALWPRLTGAEILQLLGRIGPGVDTAYRDELVERFELDVSKRPGPTRPATGRRWPWSRRSPPARRCWCWTSRPAAWIR